MTKAAPKKAATSKAKADDVPETAVPDKDHLDTVADGQPTADTVPADDSQAEQEQADVTPVAKPDEWGQPVEQKKVDQGPDVEHPTVAPGMVLWTREHLDFGDLDDDEASQFGRIANRLARIISGLPNRRHDTVCAYCGKVLPVVGVRVTHEARHEREGE